MAEPGVLEAPATAPKPRMGRPPKSEGDRKEPVCGKKECKYVRARVAELQASLLRSQQQAAEPDRQAKKLCAASEAEVAELRRQLETKDANMKSAMRKRNQMERAWAQYAQLVADLQLLVQEDLLLSLIHI